ncbi:NMP kinase [Methanocella sp. CWC-04]|uniref:Putative adenylate kinase n=1 Tax=Methanooceanicella nereidis TaxID=2052831 RepID=A0AAP2RAI2_9EURY|nr:adenylate kinase family protein [Methanocella sp. CWC-04]MCD1293589.1 NMP kinase [Methanocella sp. CWC-04]
MKIAITGTPGTGKSTVSGSVDDYQVIRINDLIKAGYNLGADEERGGALIADVDRLSEYVDGLKGDIILEGHISHLLPVDMVIVLRASPKALKKRLAERGWTEAKIRENIEAEALDVILVEALSLNEKVYEIDTTNMTPMDVREAVLEIIRGTDKYKVGSVDFSEEAFF